MSWLHSVSWICQKWTLYSAVWPVLSPTHPHAALCLYCDWPLSRERRVTGVEYIAFLFLVLTWFPPAWLCRCTLAAGCAPTGFNALITMLQVFCFWLDSMWLGLELKPPGTTWSIRGQIITKWAAIQLQWKNEFTETSQDLRGPAADLFVATFSVTQKLAVWTLHLKTLSPDSLSGELLGDGMGGDYSN